jgi:hypothetical protein
MTNMQTKPLTLSSDRVEAIATIEAILTYLVIKPADYRLFQICRAIGVQQRSDRSYVKDNLNRLRGKIENRAIDFEELEVIRTNLKTFCRGGL